MACNPNDKTEEERVKMRKLRNIQSARRSREKEKNRLEEMKQIMKQLREENTKFTQLNSHLASAVKKYQDDSERLQSAMQRGARSSDLDSSISTADTVTGIPAAGASEGNAAHGVDSYLSGHLASSLTSHCESDRLGQPSVSDVSTCPTDLLSENGVRLPALPTDARHLLV